MLLPCTCTQEAVFNEHSSGRHGFASCLVEGQTPRAPCFKLHARTDSIAAVLWNPRHPQRHRSAWGERPRPAGATDARSCTPAVLDFWQALRSKAQHMLFFEYILPIKKPMNESYVVNPAASINNLSGATRSTPRGSTIPALVRRGRREQANVQELSTQHLDLQRAQPGATQNLAQCVQVP